MRRQVNMIIINHFLNKISYKLAVAGKCQERLEKIKQRMVQFKYLITTF